ncbi:hypothetical protein ABT56_12445 [Photobacterium aquae]|uniref:Uncharacterized protein n=2 Tax=Photobacterium aquae TaxID=1195763 RepID=A0A0J1JSF2_9GAMM|nr:hypothetical protein ABT56_12445 [Photobacterium aquae]
MSLESKPSKITVKWLEDDSETIGCHQGLTFRESMQFVEDFNWGLYDGQGCSELTLYKGDDNDNFMAFHITQLGRDTFSINLQVVHKAQRKYIWSKSKVIANLGTCSKSELTRVLKPLGNYSVSRLFKRYLPETIDIRLKLLLLFVVFSMVSLFWFDSSNLLLSPTYDYYLYNKHIVVFSIFAALLITFRIRHVLNMTAKDILPCIGVGSLLMMFFVYMLALLPIAPVHYFFSVPATQIEQVSDLGSSYYGSGKGSCRGRVWLRSAGKLQRERVLCHVPEPLWRQLKIGDRLWLQGEQSPVAFSPDKMALIYQLNNQ